MRNSCISQATSFGKPETFLVTMHIMTCFEVSISLFGAYCILFKTPDKMKPVKRSMLIFHILSSSEDVFLSLLTAPLAFYPVVAWIPLGLLNAPVLQVLGIIMLLGGTQNINEFSLITDKLSETGVAILSIFENRYYLLFGKNTWWSRVRNPFLIVNFLLTPISLIPIYLLIPAQEPALLEVQQVRDFGASFETPKFRFYPASSLPLEIEICSLWL